MRLFRASRFARQIPIFLPAAVRRCPASLDNEDFVVDGVTMRLTNRDRRWDDGVLFAAGDQQRPRSGLSVFASRFAPSSSRRPATTCHPAAAWVAVVRALPVRGRTPRRHRDRTPR